MDEDKNASADKGSEEAVEEQIEKDEELARKLREEKDWDKEHIDEEVKDYGM